MGYVVARWWTFGNPFVPLSDLTALLQTLSRCPEESIHANAFDGRRHVRTRLDDRNDLRPKAFPDRLCALDLQSSRSNRTVQRPGDWALTLSVSPVSALWPPVTKGAPKSHDDYAAALSSRSVESYVRQNEIKKMPHLIQGWAVPLRGISREGQVLEVLEFLRGLRGRGGKAVATIGGVDFVSHFAEMGSYDIMAAFAALPSGWEQLVSRFDDMHKVMFGPPRMFDHISQREIRQAFTSIERLGAKSRELVMAVARTTGRGRRFAKRPAHLIVA